LLEGCCEWVDYLRSQGIRSETDLMTDLRTYGIIRVEPALGAALRAIASRLHVAEASYRRGRARLGQTVFAELWSPGCPDPKEFLRKLRKRERHRWPQRTIRLSQQAAEILGAYLSPPRARRP